MKPTIIEQLTIDTVLAASTPSAATHTIEKTIPGRAVAMPGKDERPTRTMGADTPGTPDLPTTDVTALLNLLTNIIASWQSDSSRSAPPPEAQTLRQVTICQAAAILGVHERTIRRLVQKGELHAVGRGRLTRIALRDIAEYQKRNWR